MKGYDWLVAPGTGIFDDFGQGPLDMPYHILRWTHAATSSAAGVYHVSVGASEVNSRLSRAIFRRAASLSSYRSFRDLASKGHMARMGFRSDTDPVYPDLAFSLPREWLPDYAPVSWPPRSIGVGVMSYYGWNRSARAGRGIYQRYVADMTRFVTAVLRSGFSVRLLTGDEVDDRARADLFARLSAESSARDGKLISEPIRSYQELLPQIAATDMVVASRYHNVLLSLMLDRPVISVGYTNKNDALMDEVGLAAYCLAIETLDVDALVRMFSTMTSLSRPPIDHARDATQRFRRQLDEQYDRLASQAHPRPEPALRDAPFSRARTLTRSSA